MNNLVGFRCGRSVGALGDDLDLFRDLADVFTGDLVLEGGGDQNVDVLLQPRRTGKDLVAELLRLVLIDTAEAIRDAPKLVKVDAICFTERVGGAVLLVPTGYTDDLSADPLE